MTTLHNTINQSLGATRLLAAGVSLLFMTTAHTAGAYGMLRISDVGPGFAAHLVTSQGAWVAHAVETPVDPDLVTFGAELSSYDDVAVAPEGTTGAQSHGATDPVLADLAWVAATDPDLAAALGYEELAAEWPAAAATLEPITTPAVETQPPAGPALTIEVIEGSVKTVPTATADGFDLEPRFALPTSALAVEPIPEAASARWLAGRSLVGIGSLTITRTAMLATPRAASVAASLGPDGLDESATDSDGWSARALIVAPTPIEIASLPAERTPPSVSSRGDGSGPPPGAIEIAETETPGRRAPAARTSRTGALPTLDGVIEPGEIVDVGAAVSGILETIGAERSDFVEAGQQLASLESGYEIASVEVARARAAMQSEIESGKANLALGERRVERTDRLFAKRAVSIESKDQAETEAVLARVELERARENKRLAELELERSVQALNRRTITSPISGVVVERFLSPGELVADDPILRIAGLDPLRVEVIAPADLFGRIQPGMRAEIIPEGAGQTALSATVTLVDRTIDAASGTFGLRLTLPNPDHSVPGGLRCKVRLLAD